MDELFDDFFFNEKLSADFVRSQSFGFPLTKSFHTLKS